PDFQRPNGNYDVWYIRDLATGDYVSGFENWELVEGRLLRYLVEKPLNWLGLADVAHGAYRLTERAIAWISEDALAETEAAESLSLAGNGLLIMPYSVDRYKRFQAGRFSELQPTTPGEPFAYRVTPGSLQHAKEVGIDSKRVLQFLQQASADGEIPAGLRRAIQRWSENDVEGMVEQTVILRVKEPKIIDTLRSRPETRPYLAESLSDTAVVVMPGKWSELCQATAQLGLLLEPPKIT
ncbi:MAG: helicase-associated domain-containing protein, partial [Chloroflexota bacterium]